MSKPLLDSFRRSLIIAMVFQLLKAEVERGWTLLSNFYTLRFALEKVAETTYISSLTAVWQTW